MNNSQWRKCKDPQKMLKSLRGKASCRKLRLLVCAYGRHTWRFLDKDWREAFAIGERFADGLITNKEREVAHKRLHKGFAAILTWSALVGNRWLFNTVGVFLRRLGALAGHWAAEETGLNLFEVMRGGDAYFARELETQCALLRDIFVPNRFPYFDPACRTPQALALAHTAYDERRFEDLPLLGDALEEAGCIDEAILAHLRGPGPHIRGCWVVDLVLEKN